MISWIILAANIAVSDSRLLWFFISKCIFQLLSNTWQSHQSRPFIGRSTASHCCDLATWKTPIFSYWQERTFVAFHAFSRLFAVLFYAHLTCQPGMGCIVSNLAFQINPLQIDHSCHSMWTLSFSPHLSSPWHKYDHQEGDHLCLYLKVQPPQAGRHHSWFPLLLLILLPLRWTLNIFSPIW